MFPFISFAVISRLINWLSSLRPMLKKIVIAIDGFSSCGKSTVAKQLAKELSYIYIDSGAMYRAVTYYFLKHKISIENQEAVEEALHHIHISFQLNENKEPEIYLNEENVEKAIRTMEISAFVSPVSTLKLVRHALVRQQQKMGERKGIVMDGRDIGTTVFPNAELKLFLTAHPFVRAQRRYEEYLSKGEHVDKAAILHNLAERDRIDSTRAESPLKRASDAIEIDNSSLNREQQLHLIVDLVDMALHKDVSIGNKQIEVEKYLWRNLVVQKDPSKS
jgi:cytidylate kinase